MMTRRTSRLIGVVGYPDVVALDMVGAFDAFAIAADTIGGSTPAYRCVLLSPSAEPFAAASGLRFTPDFSLACAPASIDTVIVAGGGGIRKPSTCAPIAAWLTRRAPRLRRIASVCIGIYGVAPTGLLDGRRVATHWRFAMDVAQRFPALMVDSEAIYVEDGPFWTSAGITAGIDLALALIEADHGSEVALQVAREMVVYLKRDGGQTQFSAPLRFQVAARDQLGDVVAWMAAHLQDHVTVESLAERTGGSPRNLTRRFVNSFGLPPGRVIEILRLDEARRRLLTTRGSIKGVATSVGFHSADVFRRAFERRFRISPRDYRNRFLTVGDSRRRRPVNGPRDRPSTNDPRPCIPPEMG
jgi:transcriptional regulator GlxA family with amidase domain